MKKEELIKTVQDAVEEAYKAGYAEGIKHGNINDGTFAEKVKEAYDNGLTDAWECARKILDAVVPYDAWGIGSYQHISEAIKCHSASEAIAKIKVYEDKPIKNEPVGDIKVGDEVFVQSEKEKGIVVSVRYGVYPYGVLFADSQVADYEGDVIIKTGRHFPQIAEVLQKMQEG